MAQLTDFGKQVRKNLIDRGETQTWLVEQIRGATGKYVDSQYLNKILKGDRNPATIIAAIREILELPGGESDAES